MRAFTLHLLFASLSLAADPPARQMEPLGRGLVAIPADKSVAVSWRLLGTDPDDIGFHVYRAAGKDEPKRLTDKPLTNRTHFLDTTPDQKQANSYFVRPVVKGTEGDPSPRVTVWAKGYLSIPLKTLPGHTPNDASVGDLDGDGEFDIVVKQEMTPKDNSQKGKTGQTKLEAYKLDGTFLWRIDLGRNIREGAHYTQFLVYDFDGDGRAEVMCKTADGTTAGDGKVIGSADADHRNADGYVLDGPEFLTVFDGKTGKAHRHHRLRTRSWKSGRMG